MKLTRIAFALMALAFGSTSWGQVYTKFGPATGVLKGSTATYQTTAAASTDIVSMWSGTCTVGAFLQANGVCAVPAGTTALANPSGLIGLTAANGVATTATRSDATHALDQSIAPTWTGDHTFSPTSGTPITINTVSAVTTSLRLNNTQGVTASSPTMAMRSTAVGGFIDLEMVGNSGTIGTDGFGILSDDGTSNGARLIERGNLPISLWSNGIQRFLIAGAGSVQNWETSFTGTAGLKATATTETGSFSCTLSGMTATTTGTCLYTRVGNMATIEGPAAGLSGTSNTTAMNMTGIPNFLNPVTNQKVPCTAIVNAGVGDQASQCFVLTANQINFSLLSGRGYNGAFTASGTKGLTGGFVVTYPLQ